MANFYYDRDGRPMSETEWKRKSEDESYRLIRNFDNGVVMARLVWLGKLTNMQKSSFRDTWPLFAIRVSNYGSDGVLRPDPNLDDETFAYEQNAIDCYEDFLLTWTECDRNDDGKFVEVDNIYTPPPPPDPNKPADVKIEGLTDDFGAW